MIETPLKSMYDLAGKRNSRRCLVSRGQTTIFLQGAIAFSISARKNIGSGHARLGGAIVSVVNYIQRWAVCVATMHTA